MSGLLKWSVILMLIFSVLAFLTPKFIGESSLRDSSEYLMLAKNLAEQSTHYAGDIEEATDMRLFSKRPMGYALFLSIGGLCSNAFIKLIQIFFILLLFVVGLQILRAVKLSHITGIYSLLFALSLPLYISSQWIMADLLLAVLLALCIYYFILYQINGHNSDHKRFFLLLGLSVLVKPIMLPLCLGVSLFYLIASVFKGKIKLISLFPALVILMVFMMNKRQTGVWHYSSISAINKSYYNAKLLIAAEYGSDSAEAYTEGEIYNTPETKKDYAKYLYNLNQKANLSLYEHLPSYLSLHALGMLKSLLDPGRFELYSFFDANEEAVSLTALFMAREYDQLMARLTSYPTLFGLLLVLSLLSILKLLSLLALNRKQLFVLWPLVVCLGYIVFLAGPIGAFRFLIPALLPYLLLCSIGMHNILLKFKKGSES